MTLPFVSFVFTEGMPSNESWFGSSRPLRPSSTSSKVVAEVEHEPCADELRLAGEFAVMRLSVSFVLSTAGIAVVP